MAIPDAEGLPFATHVKSVSSCEVRLVGDTIESSFTEYAPDKLIGDKAFDSNKLGDRLFEKRGVEIIVPHRKGRKKAKTQDDRKLIRYRRI